jgi:hypothetical protein
VLAECRDDIESRKRWCARRPGITVCRNVSNGRPGDAQIRGGQVPRVGRRWHRNPVAAPLHDEPRWPPRIPVEGFEPSVPSKGHNGFRVLQRPFRREPSCVAPCRFLRLKRGSRRAAVARRGGGRGRRSFVYRQLDRARPTTALRSPSRKHPSNQTPLKTSPCGVVNTPKPFGRPSRKSPSYRWPSEVVKTP